MENILEVNQVKKYYKIKTGLLQKTQYVKAVDDVSFSIKKGQTFGLVGESGCGKSTLGKVIIRLEDATSGSIIVNGKDITRLQGNKLRKSRQQYQMIFQDPYASLNPMQMVGDIISEPILNYKKLPKEEIKKEKEIPNGIDLSIKFSDNKINTVKPNYNGKSTSEYGVFDQE
ncbi:DUF1672 family protein [Staphylococcus aureus]|uniref:DUF1672 family protein n=1 Tax=Staphylococcus aureus TaxID=1280 RepID=UPI003F79A321